MIGPVVPAIGRRCGAAGAADAHADRAQVPGAAEGRPRMPLSYERDDRRRRLVVVPSGTLTLEHGLEFLDRQAAEGTWSYAVLYDGRARTAVLESAELVRLVSRTAILSKQHGP